MTEVIFTLALPVPTVPERLLWLDTRLLKPDTWIDPFTTLALIVKEDNDGILNATFALVADKVYDPLLIRAVKLAEMLPLVDVAVTLPQYRHAIDTSPFTVVMLTLEALRPLIRTPPFTLVT